MNHNHYPPGHHPYINSSASVGSNGNSPFWIDAVPDSGHVDELLALLGYQVKSTDMADVAWKIEQLEQAMCLIPNLGSQTVHYNPSDLCTWLESMITELDPIPIYNCATSTTNDFYITPIDSTAVPVLDPNENQFTIFGDTLSDYDLTLIPGIAVYPEIQQLPPPPPQLQVEIPNKRLKTSPSTSSSASASAPSSSTTLPARNWGIVQNDESLSRPVVLADLQEIGIRLVHTLMACSQAVDQGNLKVAEALLKHIGFLAASQPGAMRKVATYFGEALARRVYRLYSESADNAFSDLLELHFYETCPYLKFAHFTANQAILEAFADKKCVHIIDFSIKQGMQWPALMQALALRPGGPPKLRLTGIGPPSHDNIDHLQEVGWKLAQLAETVQVEFEYRGFVANSLADLSAAMINLREGEVVAVNSVLELHRLLARPNGIQKVLSLVKEIKPEILTVVEQEANHNGPVFLDRFNESLHYYSTLFDSLESCGGYDGVVSTPVTNQDVVMSEVYLGKQICNVVACEGSNRFERHETLEQWKIRFETAGLQPVHLGSNSFKQASMLLELFTGGDGYGVAEKDGCLMLGWHNRPLITTSAWKLG